MTWKIERVLTPDGFVVVRVSGRIDDTYVEALKELVGTEGRNDGLALDLTDVTLVNFDAVRALSHAEAQGVELRHCPAYVREWIVRERARGDCPSEP
jgi:anti-anti-sigma regulatory factor